METTNKSMGEFVEKFFKGSALTKTYPEIKQFDKSIIIPDIRKDVNAKITLLTNGTADHYEGFKCKIIHRENGLIDEKWFGFREYLPKPTDGRITSYCVLIYCGPDWHCSGPTIKDVRNMIAKMVEYIKLW